MTRVVLLAHGSPDPRSGDTVRDAAEQVAARLRTDVVAAFLDHDAPALDVAVDGADAAVVLPLLLSTAFHARVDVPAAVAALRLPVTTLDPLGHPPVVLDALLSAVAPHPVLVVAAGTRIVEERDSFEQAVLAAAHRTGTPATVAFATGPGTTVAAGLTGLAPDAVVLPWLLAPGRLLDSVRTEAAGHAVVGSGLLSEDGMLDEVARRIRVVLGRPD